MNESHAGAASRSQVVERTCIILKELARYGQAGARLLDLTSGTGLSRPTVHRVLQTLIDQDFVRQNPSRRYFLGEAIFEIGAVAPSPFDNLEPYRRLIQNLATLSGDTAYMAMRKGDHSLYLLRCEGAYPIRTQVVNASDTLPLVGSHCGHALLSAMDDREIEAIIARAERAPELFGAGGSDAIREEVDSIRANGFGWSRDLALKGVAGISAPVPNANGRSFLAVSITTISSRLERERAISLSKPLLETTKAIQALLSDRRA